MSAGAKAREDGLGRVMAGLYALCAAVYAAWPA